MCMSLAVQNLGGMPTPLYHVMCAANVCLCHTLDIVLYIANVAGLHR